MLDFFDSESHMGFGDDGTAANPADTDLGNEFIRKALEFTSKDVGLGTYLFEGKLALSEGNGNTLREIGTFDAATAGNLGIRNVLPVAIAKTSDIEIIADIELTVTVENT